MTHILVLAGLILPLALDTFALAAALGVAGIPVERRLRTSLVLAGFEAGMPIVGFVIGGVVGHVIGYFAGWTAIAFLAVAGALMLRPGDEEKEQGRLRLLARAQGLAIIDLGLAISVDELAIGFSLGSSDSLWPLPSFGSACRHFSRPRWACGSGRASAKSCASALSNWPVLR